MIGAERSVVRVNSLLVNSDFALEIGAPLGSSSLFEHQITVALTAQMLVF